MILKLTLGLCLMTTGCLTSSITRGEWLACCKTCSAPVHMDFIQVSPFSDTITCHCLSGDEFDLRYRGE